MTIDTARPFRLDIDQDYVRAELDVIFQMQAPADKLDLYVHGIRPDGARTVSASVGDHTVLYRTGVTWQQHAELEQRAAEYNADTTAGWNELLARLAAEHLGYLEIPDAASRSPFILLRFDSLEQYGTAPSAVPIFQEETSDGYRVEMPMPNGFVRLYTGGIDPVHEVAEFNAAPQAGFAFLWAAAVAERAAERQRELETLAAAQVRDIRAIEGALRQAARA